MNIDKVNDSKKMITCTPIICPVNYLIKFSYYSKLYNLSMTGPNVALCEDTAK